MKLLLALGLALAAAAHTTAQVPAREDVQPTVELRVTKGRTQVVTAKEVVSLLRNQKALEVAGTAHCEAGRGTVVTARWDGIASARVDGKASFGVGAQRGRPDRPEISFHFLRTAELELRRGELSVDLPNGWSFTQGRAVIALEERVDGRVAVTHRGGGDVVLIGPPRQDRQGRPLEPQRHRLRSGRSVLLPAGS